MSALCNELMRALVVNPHSTPSADLAGGLASKAGWLWARAALSRARPLLFPCQGDAETAQQQPGHQVVSVHKGKACEQARLSWIHGALSSRDHRELVLRLKSSQSTGCAEQGDCGQPIRASLGEEEFHQRAPFPFFFAKGIFLVPPCF